MGRSRRGHGRAPIGESRWPPALVLLGFMVINIAVRICFPRDGVIAVPWLTPLFEAALVVVLLTSDPSGAAERRRLRRVAIVLVGLVASGRARVGRQQRACSG
jgi:hypothetical protein